MAEIAGVYTRQHYLFLPCGGYRTRLFRGFADRYVAAFATGIGYGAVRAFVVATVLHLQERSGPAFGGKGGKEPCERALLARIEFAFFHQLVDLGEQLSLRRVSEHDIHAFDPAYRAGFQLGIAARDGDDGIGVRAGQLSDKVAAFLIGVFRYRTGIDDVYVGIAGRRFNVTARTELSGEGGGFGEVEFAAERVEGDFRRGHGVSIFDMFEP